jgi:hypothetical protein
LNWDDFLESWRAKEVEGYGAEQLEHVALPSELQRYYRVAGHLPTWNLHLVPPEEIVVDDHGRVVFIVEEQGVYSFATQPAGDDPPVWLYEDQVQVELGERLNRFLLQYVVYEAVGQRFGGWGWVRREDISSLLALLPPLPLEPWPHPSGASLTFHVARDLIGLVFDSGDDLTEVHVSGGERRQLESLSTLVDWDQDPLAD